MSSLPNTTAFPVLFSEASPPLLDWVASALRAPDAQSRRLRRAALKGKPIFLGSLDRPYEPASRRLSSASSPLTVLRDFDGLALRITTSSPAILDELDLLVELDRSHSVALDVVVANHDLDGWPAQEALRVVRRLAEQGLTTRIVVRNAASGGAGWRRFFAAARSAWAFDVLAVAPETGSLSATRSVATRSVATRSVATRSVATRFRRLRWEHGFPHPHPGRG